MSRNVSTLFSGLSAFPVTPADNQGRVATDRLGALVARLSEAGVHSIGALGSTGSYAYLSTGERSRAVAAAVEAAGNTPVIVGIGALRTSDVLDNARNAEKAGAAGLLLAPVSYLPLTDEEVEGLVRDVTDVTALPLCLYNNPTTTHFTLSDALIGRLASLPTVKAVKNPAPANGDFAAHLAALRPAVPADFSLGYSGDAAISGALLAGADAWYSVIAGTFPSICLEMWEAGRAGDAERLAALKERLAPVWSVFARYTSIRTVHAAVEMLGLGPASPPLPVRPLSPEARREAEAAFTAAGLMENAL